jgi:hypothetical protein
MRQNAFGRCCETHGLEFEEFIIDPTLPETVNEPA